MNSPDSSLFTLGAHLRRGEASGDARQLFLQGGRQADTFYRQRCSHDKIVRSTHGVNCTGSCSWKVYVKDGMITWHRFDTANQGIERFAGIRFLGPKSITNLLFGELMMRIVEEELHQLVLHRSKLDGLSAFLIVEGILVLRIAHGAEHISLMIPGLFSAMIV